MKLVKWIIAVGIVFAAGGVFGISIGDSSGLQAIVPQIAAMALPVAPSAPMAVPDAAPVQVGVVGVLQAVGSQSLSVETNDGMQLLTIDGKAGAEQGLSAIDQLKVGDKVAVWAQKVNGQVIASKIVVVPQTPERIHYVGLIANVSADKLDVVGQQGETTSFRLDEMVQHLPDASYAPQVGDTVTVVAKPDPRGEGWLAVAVVKQ
ncbi:MAG TPA: DUF5666 domain-containing protein [Anaerolineae bacterium]|nr:DUF5666 domain-containing protein [Anaerolineae bacterium]